MIVTEKIYTPKTSFICDLCGKEFKRYPSRNRSKNHICCSRECVRALGNWYRAKQAYDSVRVMTEPERAWLSAVIDGEGCIQIQKRKNHSYPRIVVANTSLPFLERAKEITDTGYINPVKKKKDHWKQAWTWTIDGYAVMAILEQILDSLIIKQDKAIEALALELDSIKHLEQITK